MSTEPLRWKDRVHIARHELTVITIVLATVLDQRVTTESDWQRLILSLHRMQALVEMP